MPSLSCPKIGLPSSSLRVIGFPLFSFVPITGLPNSSVPLIGSPSSLKQFSRGSPFLSKAWRGLLVSSSFGEVPRTGVPSSL